MIGCKKPVGMPPAKNGMLTLDHLLKTSHYFFLLKEQLQWQKKSIKGWHQVFYANLPINTTGLLGCLS
jgi:hypothetical protein